MKNSKDKKPKSSGEKMSDTIKKIMSAGSPSDISKELLQTALGQVNKTKDDISAKVTTEMIALAFRRSNVILETSIYIDYPGAAALIVEAANSIIHTQIVYASAYPFTPLEGIERFRKLGFTDDALEAVCYGNAARILKIAK